MNSLGVDPRVNYLYSDLYDGMVIFKVHTLHYIKHKNIIEYSPYLILNYVPKCSISNSSLYVGRELRHGRAVDKNLPFLTSSVKKYYKYVQHCARKPKTPECSNFRSTRSSRLGQLTGTKSTQSFQRWLLGGTNR